jgi:hypothetical protein
MRHKLFDFRTAYIDLLLNVLTGIIFLFIITTMMIQTKKQDEGVKKDAQYIINVEWDPNVDCDVDIWVQDPNGQAVFFNRRDFDIMHIERDDMGHKNDFIKDSNGRITGTTKDNKETWVLRGVIPGEYYVSIHLYSCRYPDANPLTALSMALKTQMNLPVKVEFIRLNPYYDLIITETVVLRKIWDEITPFNFTLAANGDVVSIDKTQHRLVRVQER